MEPFVKFHNIESGKFYCPKCSHDEIEDGKQNWVTTHYGERYKYLFFRWIYDFDNLSWDGHTSSGSWLIHESVFRESENYDRYREIINFYDKEPDPNYFDSPLGYNGRIKSETEERYVCCKCSYKGKIWDFIEKEKVKSIKTKANLILMERDKKALENEKKKLENEINKLKMEKLKVVDDIQNDENKNNCKLTLKNNDKNINFNIDCKENDKFKDIEDKFIKKYPEYSDFDLTFSINGQKIKRHKTLKDNGIKNNDIIIINIEE